MIGIQQVFVPHGCIKRSLGRAIITVLRCFYDYIKINRELRDLDLKKNLEAKIVLCGKRLKSLFLEPNSRLTRLKRCRTITTNGAKLAPVTHESKK